MRKENLKNMPIGRLHKSNASSSVSKESVAVAQSLNLLRQNIQSCVNRELDLVIKRYIDKFFEPALANLTANLGNQAVSDEHVKRVCRAILEEAKQMYMPNKTESNGRQNANFEKARNSQNASNFGDNKDYETQPEASKTICKKKVKSGAQRLAKPDNIRREAPKWDPERINKESLFVMGSRFVIYLLIRSQFPQILSRANKAMGFGPTRGRLYIKHPELFRYSGDQEDKDWLIRHSLMPPTGQKAYIMIVSDITELAQSDDYRESQTLMLHELKGFEAPDFMLQKIKNFMQHMRTDLPGGHRRYKRSIAGPSEPPEPEQPIQPSTSYQLNNYPPNMVAEKNNYFNGSTIAPIYQTMNTVDTSYFSQLQTLDGNAQQHQEPMQFYSMPVNNATAVQYTNYSVWNNDNVGNPTTNCGNTLQ
ncbi:deoxynucleotidyltransferase terminal-interacting protein 1 isoform X1 [Cloeon dipterum]|uniref:deoxynucleotidyltransferase terminal-interacting protein 1 isoform X1 n=1 Tax=Cloeon dipterum TaxID=197152 RepID=UPI00321F6620